MESGPHTLDLLYISYAIHSDVVVKYLIYCCGCWIKGLVESISETIDLEFVIYS